MPDTCKTHLIEPGRSARRTGKVAKTGVRNKNHVPGASDRRRGRGISVPVRTREFLSTGNTAEYDRESSILIRRRKQRQYSRRSSSDLRTRGRHYFPNPLVNLRVFYGVHFVYYTDIIQKRCCHTFNANECEQFEIAPQHLKIPMAIQIVEHFFFPGPIKCNGVEPNNNSNAFQMNINCSENSLESFENFTTSTTWPT